MQIEFPVAIVDKNIDRKKPETRVAAEAFLQYLFTPTAQQEFMDCGFRSGAELSCQLRHLGLLCRLSILLCMLHGCCWL